jgi:hypothetical protein
MKVIFQIRPRQVWQLFTGFPPWQAGFYPRLGHDFCWKSACYPLNVGFLLALFFNPEGGGDMLL